MARTDLRPELRNICPARMRSRPIDPRGYSIPWFVAEIDGKPDLRIADSEKRVKAIRNRLCWVCGERLGVHLTFVIGPMCVVNRVTSEPPVHMDCGLYSVKGCPFLTRPLAQYRTANMPDGVTDPGGIALTHNPGACALYTTKTFGIMQLERGFLIRLGDPESVQFWHAGKIATRAEVDAAVSIGLPKLRALAEEEGAHATAELDRMLEAAAFWFPVDGTGAEARV